MNNRITYTMYQAFQKLGFSVMRFNFRGVGASEGRYDQGVGEVADALAVIDWTRRHFDCDSLWLGGFSFGAAIALQAAVRGARPVQIVTIAPPPSATTVQIRNGASVTEVDIGHAARQGASRYSPLRRASRSAADGIPWSSGRSTPSSPTTST